ncbi:hypothetical protein QTO34_006785 [Cnephaeus nilssonii]|uniref:Uncharacterized protein n=1 Tax=Cnephaeus nilssonii TaxID=3371016 RepID=A0AA40HL67_CNENI|nr:hypothetical protein QTO34_006785 [Eptesicus nilssonii]
MARLKVKSNFNVSSFDLKHVVKIPHLRGSQEEEKAVLCKNEGLCLLEKGRLRSQQGKRPSREEAKAERPSLSLSLEAERREDQDAVRAGQVPGFGSHGAHALIPDGPGGRRGRLLWTKPPASRRRRGEDHGRRSGAVL